MPRDTLLGRDAGAVAEPTQGVLGLLKRYWRAFREWRQNPRVILQDLSDRELMDIGLTRGDLYRLAPGRAIDALRDRTRYLLNHTGM
uniref:YjiS-like domain-containing protein n=2 Tax=Bradyrhizobium amphicarpaeae TaxID=1404768 RepID=A0A2U8Q3V5_9BRAD|nr:hypothetical protein CIT40_21510 [Bradyrhizobium amphicarpaeae]